MVDENKNLNLTAEGSNAASGSKQKGKERASEGESNFASSSRTNNPEISNSGEIIRTSELAVEKEILNLKNKVAEKGKNESFLEFEKKNEEIKKIYKNKGLLWQKVEKRLNENKMSNLRQFGEALELEGDFVLREIIPFYGSFTTSVTEKSLQKLIEYYQEQFSQLTNSIANDQENIFSEVKNVLKEKNNKIAEMERGYDKLKEQADAEREERKRERKADDEKLAIVEREKEEIQNALLSTEKSEIEQLKAERNQLRTNTEEQEKFLTRLFKEYENLELRRKLTVKELELMFLEFKKRGTEAEQLRSDKIALSTDNTILNERVKNLTKDIKEAKDKITELTSEKVNLEAQVTNLEIEKKDWKEKYEKEKQQKRIGLIANVAQGAIEWLPIPEKWQGGLKTSIQAVSVWALWKDLPNWTYEGLIMLVGVGLWYFVLYFLRKINRVVFGRKEKKQISNLEKALTNIIEAGTIKREKKEPNSPAVVSKEAVITGEVVREISDEKTDPIREEKAEIEKPAKKGKNRKKRKKQKKGKK